MFAGFIVCVWVVTHNISNQVELVFQRSSPSYYLGQELNDLKVLHPEKSVKVYAPTSLPSNHGNVFFTLFIICLYRWGKKAAWLGLMALLFSTPRMLTGAHWFTDVVLGSVLMSWLVAAHFLATPIFDAYLRLEQRAADRLSQLFLSLTG